MSLPQVQLIDSLYLLSCCCHSGYCNASQPRLYCMPGQTSELLGPELLGQAPVLCLFCCRVIFTADKKTPFSRLYPAMPDYPQQSQDLEKQGYSTDPNYSQPTSSNTSQDRGIFSNLLAGGVASHFMRPQPSPAPSPALPVETDAPPPQCTFSAFIV